MQIFQQGECASCCAAAVATQLSLRQCMRFANKTQKLYSAQQIWDCAAPAAAGTCASGVVLDTMIEAIGVGSRSSHTLVDARCTAPLQTKQEPNMTQCVVPPSDCMDPVNDRIGGVEQYKLSPYMTGILDYASLLASRALMNAIYENGPVVAVLSFRNAGDFANFASYSFLKGGRVFMPSLPASGAVLTRHCVVVLGWGTDAQSGHDYWLVQNSYGDQWADGGFARILRGVDMLEGNWRGLFLASGAASTPAPPAARMSLTNILTTSGSMPSYDIVALTFFCSMLVAGLIVAVFSRHLCRSG